VKGKARNLKKLPYQLMFFFLLVPELLWAFSTFDSLIKFEFENLSIFGCSINSQSACIGGLKGFPRIFVEEKVQGFTISHGFSKHLNGPGKVLQP
jgi:hypothetical protein